MKPALAIAFGLVLVIALASAMLRLSNAGAGCTPWPQCLAERTAAADAPAEVPAWHEPVRLAHRVAASAAGLVFLFVVLFGWARWNLGERLAGLSLLLLSLGLAWIGRHTPSALPAVVVANLLGGHLLLAALAWLLVRPAPTGARPTPRMKRLPWLVVALVLLQGAGGAMVSARGAAAACLGGCPWVPEAAVLAAAADPWLVNTALPAGGAASPERQALLQAHAVGALLLAAVALAVALRSRRRLVAWLPLAAVVAAAAIGWLMRGQALPLAAPVIHGLLAALALVAAVVLARHGASARHSLAEGPQGRRRRPLAPPHTAAP